MIFHKKYGELLVFFIFVLNIISGALVTIPVTASGYITRTVTVTNSSGLVQTNYPIEGNLNTATEITAMRMRSDCGDIRAYNGDAITPLNYSVLNCNRSYTSIVFVVPLLPTGVSTYFITFGDLALTSNENPSAVFDIYEMFTSTTPTCSLAGNATWDNSNNWLTLTPNISNILGSCNYSYLSSLPGRGFVAFFDVWTGGTGTSSQATWLYTFDSIIPTNEDIVQGGTHFTIDDGQNRVCVTTQTAANGAGSCDGNFGVATLDNSTWRSFKTTWDTSSRNITFDGISRFNNSGGVPPNLSNTNFGFAGRNGTTPAERRVRNFAVIRFTTTITSSISVTNTRPVESLSFVIRNSADTSDFNNTCDFGDLNATNLFSCQYRLKISTNAKNGYTVYTQTSGGLQAGSATISDANAGSGGSGGSLIAAGTEKYGALLTRGSCTGGTLTPTAAFNPGAGNSVKLNYTSTTPILSCNGPNAPLSVDTNNTTLVNLQVAISGNTAPGNYTQTITWTVVPNY